MTKEILHKIYTMNQEELRDYIISFLEEKNIEYKLYNGNIYSFRFKDKVAFVSHMDTVADDDEEYHKPVFELNGILFKRNAVLGADDRAGINLILNHIDNINFVITKDEEIGRIGAANLRKYKEFEDDVINNNIIGFIEMDRKNNSDILGFKHGYCNEDFHDAISSVLTGRIDAVGSVTDIDSFIDLRPAVNISCGYHSPHSSKEYLDIDAWLNLNNKIMELHNNVNGSFSVPKKKYYKSTSSKYYTPLYSENFFNNDLKRYAYTSSYSDNYFSSFKTDLFGEIELDLEETIKEYKEGKRNNFNIPEIVDEETILNLEKFNNKYYCCHICGSAILKGDDYHIINGNFVHDSCLLDKEKIEFGILPLE